VSYSDRPAKTFCVSKLIFEYVCRATIQDCKKKKIKIPERNPDFRAKVEFFLVLPKFDWKMIFLKFQRKMVQEG
jgi:hypothetical protein